MSDRPAVAWPGWLVTLLFAATYVVAALIGRLTVLDQGAPLGLFWPAAGFAALWFLVRGLHVVDVVLFAGLTFAVNNMTGSSLPMSLVLTVANLAQLFVFLGLLRRWRPSLWGVGGSGRLDSPAAVGAFLAAAVSASFTGAALGSLGLWAVADESGLLSSVIWFARNLCGLFAMACFGHLLAHTFRFAAGSSPAIRRRSASTVEMSLLLMVTLVAYVGIFRSDMQLAFPLLPLAIWAGIRLSTVQATAHALACGVVAILLTRFGFGPFAILDDPMVTALFLQIFVIVIVVVTLVLATLSDEQARARAELRLAEREAATQANLFENVLDVMHDGVVVIEGRRVVFENPGARTQLRGSPLQSGRAIVDAPAMLPDGSVLHGPERPLTRALAGEAVRDLDLLVESHSGPRIVAVSARPLAPGDESGDPRAVLVFRDVTDERAQRTDLMSFAGAVAHDLRNPLQSLEGWLEQLGRGVDVGLADHGVADLTSVKEMVVRAQRASSRMRNLIQDLLDHAVATSRDLHAAHVDLGSLARELSVGRGVTLAIGPLPGVWADPVLVRQLLDNLIGNAAKYVAPGVSPEVHLDGIVDGGHVRVRIRDNGIGIPPDERERIFEEFHRAHSSADYSGTGLGLSICRRIVERHGGAIRCQDSPSGQGTIFEFTLPAHG